MLKEIFAPAVIYTYPTIKNVLLQRQIFCVWLCVAQDTLELITVIL